MKTTNYYDTFIKVAEDCPVETAEIPPERGGKKTKVRIQYEMISKNPYRYTSDDVLFNVHVIKKDIPPEKQAGEREKFFSKGRACLRASALGKRYGWGIHFNAEGKTALYAVESEKYTTLVYDKSLKQLEAMRSSRS